MAVSQHLTGAREQVHDARILLVSLPCVVRFDDLVAGHVLGIDQRRVVAEAPGRLEQLLLVAAGRLAQHGEAAEAELAG